MFLQSSIFQHLLTMVEASAIMLKYLISGLELDDSANSKETFVDAKSNKILPIHLGMSLGLGPDTKAMIEIAQTILQTRYL